MKFRSLTLALSAAILFAGHSAAQEKTAFTEKLDKLLRYPGDYSQICDAMESPYPAPVPAFRSIMHGEAGFSKANLQLLQKNRAKVIPALAAKLQGLDLLQVPKPQPKDPSVPKASKNAELVSVDPIGVDPACFNTLLLTVIEELDAVEVLPQLLVVEEKFHQLLSAAEKDPNAPLPRADGSEGAGVNPTLLRKGEEYDKMSAKRKAELERMREVFRAQAVHRDILAVCGQLMRKAGYEPVFTSNLETLYGKALKAKYGKDEVLSKYKSAADIPAAERPYIKFDPVHKIAYRESASVRIPYTPELRKELITLTHSFVASRKR